MRDSLFMRAVRGEDTERAPVWFMRQAGRHLPEYRKLKETYSFWEMVREPELALEVTMQPIRRYGMDAAIFFSDIMTPLPPMGLGIEFKPGPVIDNPVRTVRAVEQLRVPEAEEIAPFVPPAMQLITAESPVPLIGFGGAPLTLAAYMVQGSGSKDYGVFRGFLRSEPVAAHQLMEKLTKVSIRYLRTQAQAGASAVQLFDSWAGLHGAKIYGEFGVPYIRRIVEALREDVPVIYFAPHATHLAPQFAEVGADVLGADWRVSLADFRAHTGAACVQGNMDPAVLFGSPESIRNEVNRVLEDGKGGAHVFNLGHGMMKECDPDHVAAAVDAVKSFERH